MPYHTNLSNRFLLSLVHNSIDQFKNLFPNEDPFIKIICMRDRRLMAELKSNNKEWRSVKLMNNKNDVIDLVKLDETHKFKRITKEVATEKKYKVLIDEDKLETKISIPFTKKDLKSKGNDVVMKRNRKWGNKIIETREVIEKITTHEIEDINNDIMAVQVEIMVEDLQNRSSFITSHVIQSQLVITQKFVDTVDEIKNMIVVKGKDFQLTEDNVEKLINDCLKIKEELKDSTTQVESFMVDNCAQTIISEVKKEDHIESVQAKLKKYLKTDKTVDEIVDSYIEIQRKLNVLRKNIHKYTEDYELEWKEKLKEKGFILALEDLVHYYWDLTVDY
jgi:hypothetical protein